MSNKDYNSEEKVIIDKLVYACNNFSATNNQACIYAGISKRKFNIMLKDHPELLDTMEMARDNLSFKAKQNIRESIINEGDIKTSKWWLEHHDSNEFSTTIKGDISTSTSLNFEDKDEIFAKLLKNLKD